MKYMKVKSGLVRAAVLLLFGLSLAAPSAGQTSSAGTQGSDSPPASERADVGSYLDRILERTRVASEAASVITEADKYRREAEQMLKAGRRDEARELLRRSGEVIAAATPEGDEKLEDPLLREYLREITGALVALEGRERLPDTAPETVGGFDEGNASRPEVAAFRNYFLGRGRQRLDTGRARLAQYRSMMTRIFREEGVPEWLIAVGFVESTYSTAAHSPKHALGIWQFIPGTGDRYGLQRTVWTDERQHPEKSTRAAARYLRNLHALFGDWLLALTAYNWGEGRVAKVIKRTGIRDFWTMAQRGLMPDETKNYVPAVLAASQLLNVSADATPGRVGNRGDKSNGSAKGPTNLATPDPGTSWRQSPPMAGTDREADVEQETAPESVDMLERLSKRFDVPASEIRQVVPGYYDIPSYIKGRRVYVRVRGR